MAVFIADLYEPIDAVVTADTTAYSADNATWPTADGGILVGALDAADAAVIAAGVSVLVEAAAAADFLDAEVIAAEVPLGGGGFPPLRLFPVVGVGFGILPELEGEAHGVVVVVGTGVGALPGLVGDATGTTGVAGRSAARLVAVRAAAIGSSGQVAAAVAVLKSMSVASAGVVGIRGSGLGTIMKFEGAANGRHNDDEAAVVLIMLAA